VEVVEELIAIIEDLSTLEADRRLIFTGTDDVFASGADLREIASVSADEAESFARRGQKLMNMIGDLDTSTIAAVNGYCFGGAIDLALACDRRLASQAALFSHPGANLGIITGWGGTQRLPRLIGEANALEMFFTAKRVDSGEALRLGLVDMVVSDPLTEALNSPR
jgi:enoyl-CoA hydratase/carnithine racemase